MSGLDAWEAEHQRRQWGTAHDIDVSNFARHYLDQDRDICDRWPTTVLDLGCGVGAQSYFLAREGFTVTGIDGSARAIERAIRRKPHWSLNPIFEVARLDQPLRYDTEHFDGVIDVSSLQCLTLEQAGVALAEVSRILKPGGMFLSMTAASDCDPLNHTIGYVRQSSDDELSALYCSHFADVNAQKRTHVDGFEHEVKLWVIVCRKAGG